MEESRVLEDVTVFDEIYLGTARGKLFVKCWGNPLGKRVLALHGWLDNAGSFDFLAPKLSAAGCRVAALDFPGHGRSFHKSDSFYSPLDYVHAVYNASKALGWSRFVLLGHSMGAGVATLFTTIFPECVERLVLLDGLGLMVTAPEESVKKVRHMIHSMDILSKKSPHVYDSLQHAVQARLRSPNNVPPMLPKSAEALVLGGTKEVHGKLLFTYDLKLRAGQTWLVTAQHVISWVQQLQHKPLVVAAEDGYLLSDSFRGRFYKLLEMMGSGYDLVRVPGKHHVHMDAPEVVANVVLPFCTAPSDSSNASNDGAPSATATATGNSDSNSGSSSREPAPSSGPAQSRNSAVSARSAALSKL